MHLLVGIVAALSTTFVLAQVSQPSIPDDVLRNLAKDLADLQSAVAKAQQVQQLPTYENVYGALSGFGRKVMVTSDTSLFAGAEKSSRVTYNVKTGQTLDVVGQAGEWFAVPLEKPTQSGLTTAWVPAANVSFVAHPKATASNSGNEGMFRSLTEQAARMRESYKNNPYVTVSGFTVSVLPPSVSVNFDFK